MTLLGNVSRSFSDEHRLFCVQVTLSCDVSRSFTDDTYDDDTDGGLVVRDMYLQGAAWDMENNCLKDTT